MARRGGPLVSDSDDSDVTEDDDVSDVEDDLLRQKVRAAAAVRGGGHTAHTSVSDPHDGVGARAGTGTAGRGVTSGAPGVSGSVPSTGGAAATTTTGNSHRVNTHTNNTTNNTADPQIDDEERAVLCFAVDDDDDVTNNNAPRTVAGVNSGQIGPELRKLRQAQGEHAEYYTLEHYDRLYGRRVKWDRNSRGSKTWCKDVHGPGCTECTSCHFCRQKTSDVKTRCQCGEWRKQPPGGRGRGAWCGWCLEMRVGENIVEALGDDEWRCPVCRDICNCSGANCQRAKRNLFPTQQLTHEAEQFGWQSVAHYLITTRISEHSAGAAPPILQLPRAQREQFMRRRNEIGGGGGANGGGISETARLRRARRAEEDLRRKRASVLREAVARRLRHALSGGSGVTSSSGNLDGGSNPNRGGNSVFVLSDDSSGSSGSDLDSNDDDGDDEADDEADDDDGEADDGDTRLGAPGVGGFGDVDANAAVVPDGVPGNRPDPISVDVDGGHETRRHPASTSAGRDHTSSTLRRDRDTVPDPQSDEEEDGERIRRGGGGWPKGGGGGGNSNRHAKRPRLDATAANSTANQTNRTNAYGAVVDLTQGDEATEVRRGATAVNTSNPPSVGPSRDVRVPEGNNEPGRGAPRRPNHSRTTRRRDVTASRRLERRAARELASVSAEISSERELSRLGGPAGDALRDLLAAGAVAVGDVPVGAVGRGEPRIVSNAYAQTVRMCLDRCYAAVVSTETAYAARTTRLASAKRGGYNEDTTVGDAPPSVVSSERTGSDVTALERDVVAAAKSVDEALSCFCAAVVFVSRSNGHTDGSLSCTEGWTLSNTNCAYAYNLLLGGPGAQTFRERIGTRRALVLRTALRSLEHVITHAVDAEGNAAISQRNSAEAKEGVKVAAEKVASASTAVLSILAVLGEEFCLLREHARWVAAGGVDASNEINGVNDSANARRPPPPPLPPALVQFIGEDGVVRVGDTTGTVNGGTTHQTTPAQTTGTSAADAAERLLERMEECHVLLSHALKVLRRFVGVKVGKGTVFENGSSTPRRIVPPGAAALVSPTLAAFLEPRFPFRARLRKKALAVVAACASAVRLSADTFDPSLDGSFAPTHEAIETRIANNASAPHSALLVAIGLSETVWPALVSLLECDHPARRKPSSIENASHLSSGMGNQSEITQPLSFSSGCSRATIEACARVMSGLLKTNVWSWGRAESEITAPYPTALVFWKTASAPYRALALRLFSRLCVSESSPVLVAGAGVPLLKLWALATSDPAAASVSCSGGGDGSSSAKNGSSVGGFGRARSRFAKCVRRHPGLGFVALPLPVTQGSMTQEGAPTTTPADASLSANAVDVATRAEWIRGAILNLANKGGAAAAAAAATANLLWDIAPSRLRETAGDGVGNQWHDLLCAIASASVSKFPTQLHGSVSGADGGVHDFGRGILVGQNSVTKLTAMVHVVAARHCLLTANASSAKTFSENALVAAAYAGSSRAEAAQKCFEVANQKVQKSATYFADCLRGVAVLFDRGSTSGNTSGTNASVNDATLIGAVVALCHAGWERGPPRCASEDHRDLIVAATRAVTQTSSALNSFIQSAIVRKALMQCVPPNRVGLSVGNSSNPTHGGHAYPPGSVAAATHTFRFLSQTLHAADASGTVPETLGSTFCVIAGSVLDVLNPPPPPPDPRRSAPPSGAQAAPPNARSACYAYLAQIANERPNALGGTGAGSNRVQTGEYLRQFAQFACEIPASVVDDVVCETLRAAVVCAACEVAASAGFKGAKAAAASFNSSNSEKAVSDVKLENGVKRENGTTDHGVKRPPGLAEGNAVKETRSTDQLARDAVEHAKLRFRSVLGSHPNSGAHEEVLKRFKPNLPGVGGGGGGTLDNAFNSLTRQHGKPSSGITQGASSKDLPIGKDFDVANHALGFLASMVKISDAAAAAVTKLALPILAGALGDDGDPRLRRYTRNAVCDLWDIVSSLAEHRRGVLCSIGLPPIPPEQPTQRPGHPKPVRQPGAVTLVRSTRDAMGSNASTPSGRVGGTAIIHKTKPWPVNVADPMSFSALRALCEKVSKGDPEAKKQQVSVIGAVVARDPKSGTKTLTNPKTNREYCMVFLTLADHTGARVKAQLLGNKATQCANVLDKCDTESLGGGRVVVGLCDVLARASASTTGHTNTTNAGVVWDPKETSMFVLRPSHAMASKLG